MNELATDNSRRESGGDGSLRILPSDSPFTNLDAIVLSIEWEITDETMDTFLTEISRLKKYFKNDKIIYSLLQLHGTAGKYIRVKKVKAHPDSLRLLHSVHDGLVTIVAKPDITEADKRKILSNKIKQFKDLKNQIIESGKVGGGKPAGIRIKHEAPPAPVEEIEKATPITIETEEIGPPENIIEQPPPEPKETVLSQTPEDDGPEILPEALALAVEEIKAFIREELKTFKQELQSMKNGS